MCRVRVSAFVLVILLVILISNFAFAQEKEISMTVCELLALCHQATSVCHNKEVVLPNYPEPHTLVTTLRGPADHDILGFITETPTRIFIVFRGSQNRKDLKRDINCVKVPFYLAPNAGRVHRGFLEAYTKVGKGRSISLRDFIFKTIKGLDPVKKLYIAGHSMGGALATLCALDVAVHNSFFQPMLCTFASPRVGDRTFLTYFNKMIDTCVRVKNTYDYVTSMPLKCMGYEHVKGELMISVRANCIENRHRVLTAYFPGVVSRFEQLIQELIRFNPAGLFPAAHFPDSGKA